MTTITETSDSVETQEPVLELRYSDFQELIETVLPFAATDRRRDELHFIFIETIGDAVIAKATDQYSAIAAWVSPGSPASEGRAQDHAVIALPTEVARDVLRDVKAAPKRDKNAPVTISRGADGYTIAWDYWQKQAEFADEDSHYAKKIDSVLKSATSGLSRDQTMNQAKLSHKQTKQLQKLGDVTIVLARAGNGGNTAKPVFYGQNYIGVMMGLSPLQKSDALDTIKAQLSAALTTVIA